MRAVTVAVLLVAIGMALPSAATGQDIDRFRAWRGATPPLELKDLAGNTHTLAQYQGRVALINFWATWCPPCRDEMPSLQQLQQRLAGQPFVILGVNYGESPGRINGFLKQMALDFPILRDPRHEAVEAWRVRTLPTSFLVGPDGQLRYWIVGELDWAADDVLARVRKLFP